MAEERRAAVDERERAGRHRAERGAREGAGTNRGPPRRLGGRPRAHGARADRPDRLTRPAPGAAARRCGHPAHDRDRAAGHGLRGAASAPRRAGRGIRPRSPRERPSGARAELETHESERRRALQQVAERLRERERELRERIASRGVRGDPADPGRLRRRRAPAGRPAEAHRRAHLGARSPRRSRSSSPRRSSAPRGGRATALAASSTGRSPTSPARPERPRRAARPRRGCRRPATRAQALPDRLVARARAARADRRAAEADRRRGAQAALAGAGLAADAEAERSVLSARLNELQRRLDAPRSEAGVAAASTTPKAR